MDESKRQAWIGIAIDLCANLYHAQKWTWAEGQAHDPDNEMLTEMSERIAKAIGDDEDGSLPGAICEMILRREPKYVGRYV